jgi:hypothetical protein
MLVGNNQLLNFEQTANGLTVNLPETLSNVFAYSLKILPA